MIETFIRRLNKIGIEITLIGNYPWIYLDTVNGNKVKEKYNANHGFNIGYLTKDNKIKFEDLKVIFNAIRKYK